MQSFLFRQTADGADKGRASRRSDQVTEAIVSVPAVAGIVIDDNPVWDTNGLRRR
ncbi:hypothetical protein CCAX7_001880 [Capsulimonas corticalis]|uniref:Uncharacterized protein n=1 Tax=Capsulimonas corticalis TaxID=2219043 RepID=A0A402CRS3_9BACT|nr:hypothetical protein CCAX7_001880 [Capsulimonas corticalis]